MLMLAPARECFYGNSRGECKDASSNRGTASPRIPEYSSQNAASGSSLNHAQLFPCSALACAKPDAAAAHWPPSLKGQMLTFDIYPGP